LLVHQPILHVGCRCITMLAGLCRMLSWQWWWQCKATPCLEAHSWSISDC